MYRKASEKDLFEVYGFEKDYMEEIEPDNLGEWIDAESRIKDQLLNSLDKMFLADANGQVVGHCYWSLYKDVPHIFSIFVSKLNRGCGIASKLMAYVEADIRSHGFSTCKLSTRTNNPAKNWFNALGYTYLNQKNEWLHYEKHL